MAANQRQPCLNPRVGVGLPAPPVGYVEVARLIHAEHAMLGEVPIVRRHRVIAGEVEVQPLRQRVVELEPCPLEHQAGERAAFAFPYVLVQVVIHGLQLHALKLKLSGEPRVIAPVDFHHQRVGIALHGKSVVYVVALLVRVVRPPDFGPSFADRRYQDFRASFADAMRLLDPRTIAAFIGLDRIDRVILQAGKKELRAVGALDRRGLHVIELAQAKLADLVAQQLVA